MGPPQTPVCKVRGWRSAPISNATWALGRSTGHSHQAKSTTSRSARSRASETPGARASRFIIVDGAATGALSARKRDWRTRQFPCENYRTIEYYNSVINLQLKLLLDIYFD